VRDGETRSADRRLAAVLALAAACGGGTSRPDPPGANLLVHWVDPFIGTGGEGNTFPGATVPWGMVAPSPHTRLSSVADYLAGDTLTSAGYRDGDTTVQGFGLTHVSGAGCPDLGAPVLAAAGATFVPGDYRTALADERAWPGYYGADLPAIGATVDITATARAAVLRFGGAGHILVDAARSLSWAGAHGHVRLVSPAEVEGYSDTGLFCLGPNRGRVYFVVELDRAADAAGLWQGTATIDAAEADGDVGAWLRVGGDVEARVGVSYVSVAGARANLVAELADKSFDDVHLAAEAAWEKLLARAVVQGGTDADRTIFYTALYHTLLHPSLASDVDGGYVRFGGGTAVADHPRYHVFSLWDTYRAVHPLLALLYPETQRAMARSIAEMTVEAGAPPRWELAGGESDIMVGDPADIVLGDSVVKGLAPDGLAAAAPVLVAAADDATHRPGAAEYAELGYVPMDLADDVWGPASTTLEYALADFALARIEDSLSAPAAALDARARGFLALWDGSFLRPRFAAGDFLAPFDPDALQGSRPYPRSGGPGYVEGTAWTYLFAAPHALAALADAMGGDAAFVARLQELFDDGKFATWNEPDLGYPYAFTHFAGEGWRTAEAVRAARAAFTAERAGIPGNDDAGAMSAWYVFSALGIYPDVPAVAEYAIGTPLFDRAELTVSGGTFVIDAPHPSAGHIFVRAASLGSATVGQRLAHADVAAGGTLSLTLSDTK
jgi:predicted alpha-1,2-mannosidase